MVIDLAPQPAGINIKGIKVCYESTSTLSFISQIRISEVQNPPSTALVRLDDGTDLSSVGPLCVDSRAVNFPIPTTKGPLLLNIKFNFGTTKDAVVIRGLGVILG
jgi:hypothetical protein